uniref:Putative secreted peptide n=1 Tax=Anopheles braziliensis TaxID=58242 RepID=A0A2M3ZRB1_9DIPT
MLLVMVMMKVMLLLLLLVERITASRIHVLGKLLTKGVTGCAGHLLMREILPVAVTIIAGVFGLICAQRVDELLYVSD